MSVEIRLRPSYFQFTEPSVEMDVSCFVCGGTDPNCKVCKGAGWLEMLGAGMVDPGVLEEVGYDPEEYTGYAFGMGPDRMAMVKYACPGPSPVLRGRPPLPASVLILRRDSTCAFR